MVRAEFVDRRYLAFPTDPVGDHKSLPERLTNPAEAAESLLIGFDFLIRLPAEYCRKTRISDFREAHADARYRKMAGFLPKKRCLETVAVVRAAPEEHGAEGERLSVARHCCGL